ncbi:class I SAM-dependent methyltransferase [uncultured Megasphaera sp.]|uniref:class I SAM-dependent methyltransferase n=2 Tax=uncultured Megasphaera sp. TaxID=165188 RepID=UPI0025DA08A8|nr:class I SAM-dependent methyltransferase [uncultured Megasphaera sp.]
MSAMVYVVPSLKAKEKLQAEGRRWAESQGFTWQARQKRTIQDLMAEYGENFLVYSSRGPQIDRPEGSHFFSLNMAELRIQNLRKGQPDHLLEALMGMKEREGRTLQSAALTAPLHRGASRTAAAQPPITILDCTCGFGADAAVASFGLPAGSRIDALEVSPLLEAVTSWGFSHFVHKKDDVTAALRRISLRRGDYRDYLLSDEGPVYDVLYFDPMFQRPVEASCQFQPVRAIMEHGGLTRDLIERALQKARRRVVIKERDFRQLCRDFPDVTLYGGKYSRIGYAVLECDSWKK